jgi:hypothetical protein
MTTSADFRDRNNHREPLGCEPVPWMPPHLLNVAEAQVDRLNQALRQMEAEREHFSIAFMREQRDHEFTERRLSTLKADLLKVQLQLEQMHHRALNAERALLEYEISQIETPEAS